jgi:Kelch motif
VRRQGLLAAAAACLSLLVACAGGSHRRAAPTVTPPTTGGTAPRSSQPFVPHHLTAGLASWRLPFASGRQAVVPLGHGRVLLAGGLLAGDMSTNRVTRIDLRSGTTASAPSLAVPVHDVAGALADRTPMVIGGGNATEQDVVQRLKGGVWRVVGHLPTTRSDLSVVADAGSPLVIGGYDGVGTPTALLVVGRDGSVRPRGRLARGVRYSATAVLGHTAYVFGGEVLGRELDAVQAIDLRDGHTTVVGRMPVPLGHAMAATIGARILVLGGRVSPDRQTADVWWFDPGSARFTRAGSLPHATSDAAVATVGHRVWLLGGEDPSVSAEVMFVNVG